MGHEDQIRAALNELRRTREGLAAVEEAVEAALETRKEAFSNQETALEAFKKENSDLKTRLARFDTALGACITVLSNARRVYETFVTRGGIDEKIAQIRKLRSQ